MSEKRIAIIERCGQCDYRRWKLNGTEYAIERGVVVPPMEELKFGGVVGVVDVFSMAYGPLSKWFMGPVGWQLRNPQPLPFMPVNGQLGLFDVDVDLERIA